MVEFGQRLSFLQEHNVTLLTRDMFHAMGRANTHAQQSMLSEVIDKLGARSAKAQGYQVRASAAFLRGRCSQLFPCSCFRGRTLISHGRVSL